MRPVDFNLGKVEKFHMLRGCFTEPMVFVTRPYYFEKLTYCNLMDKRFLCVNTFIKFGYLLVVNNVGISIVEK